MGLTQKGSELTMMVKFATYRARQRVYKARSNLKNVKGRSPGNPWPAPSPGALSPTEGESDHEEHTVNENADEDGDTGEDAGAAVGAAADGHADAAASRVPHARFWINEDLTKVRANVLWNARKLKKIGKIEDCWSFDGSIFIKTKYGRVERVANNVYLKQYNDGHSVEQV